MRCPALYRHAIPAALRAERPARLSFLEGGQMLPFRSQCRLILHESALDLSHAFTLLYHTA